ncbi:hypothetical protein BSKO_09788 [Bryopsis sp. KO-2023]|nr:hypothetical protein BSKO_09788 [Bryopsis sp. KO-2023]
MACENSETRSAEEEPLETTRLLIEEAVQNDGAFFKTGDVPKDQQDTLRGEDSEGSEEGDGKPLDGELFELLQKCVESPEFYAKLESVRALKMLSEGDQPQPNKKVLTEEEQELESYEVVTKDDAVNAMVAAIVQNIIECPEADQFSHQDLQNAVANTCEALKQGRVRRYWEWGKWVYRVCAVGTGVFQAFTHPWIAKAVMMGIWRVPRFLLGLFF